MIQRPKIGRKSVSIASNAKARTNNAVAIGHSAEVKGTAGAGIALGWDAKAEGDATDSIAIGRGAKCEKGAVEAIAIGRSNNAQALETIAIGSNGKGEERARLWFCLSLGMCRAKDGYRSSSYGLGSHETLKS